SGGRATTLCGQRVGADVVRLELSVLAYILGNLWRRLVLPARVDTWSLTSLQQRLVKTGGRLVKHARYYWLLLAEGHLTRRLFGATLGESGRCRTRRADRRLVTGAVGAKRGRNPREGWQARQGGLAAGPNCRHALGT